jgi:hypothetical protein
MIAGVDLGELRYRTICWIACGEAPTGYVDVAVGLPVTDTGRVTIGNRR